MVSPLQLSQLRGNRNSVRERILRADKGNMKGSFYEEESYYAAGRKGLERVAETKH